MKTFPTCPRILVLTSTFPRWYGDTEPPFVLELCRRLTENFNIHVLAPHAPGALSGMYFKGMRVSRYRYFFPPLETLAYRGGILANLKHNPWRYTLIPFFLLSQTLAIHKLIRRFKFDLIHAHWIIPQGLCAVFANKLIGSSGPPILCTSHGGDLYGLSSKPMIYLKRKIIKISSALTTVSRRMKDDIGSLYINLEKVHVIPMGVDLKTQFVPPARRKTTHSILFVGRVVEKKGLRYLVEAMPKIIAAHPKSNLVVAGDGHELDSIKNLAKERGVEEHIQFIGSVPNEDLTLLYQKSDVVVFPSIVDARGDREGFGLVLVEALGCECAVVATDLPATRDIIKDGETALIVHHKDARKIAEKVIDLLNDSKLRIYLGKKGRQHVLRQFDWDIIANRYADLIQCVLKRSKA